MPSPNTPFTSGAILTASQMNNLPFGRVAAPISIITNQTGIGTVVDVTGATFTWTAVANRLYKLCWYGLAQSTIADTGINVFVTDASNNIQAQCITNISIANQDVIIHGAFVFTPGAGSITRKLRVQRQYGTGTLQLTAGGSFPWQYWIEDLGIA